MTQDETKFLTEIQTLCFGLMDGLRDDEVTNEGDEAIYGIVNDFTIAISPFTN